MIWRGGALATGMETPLFGDNTSGSTEANTQVTATEACTLSDLRGTINSGGSGTNTFQFRKNGANGNQVASRAGTGVFEDAVNTDALITNDLFNIAYTDDGTDSNCWIGANVEFSSGHGNFHGAAASNGGSGATFNNDSATNFLPFGGSLNGDAEAGTEADAQWKNRGYTSIEALQVRVSSNARTTTSTFKDRKNGADGGFQIDYAAGITGTVVDTSTASSLSDGDLINVSLAMGSGAAENLVVPFVCGTFKSTTGKSEIWAGDAAGEPRTASGTANHSAIGGGLVINTVSDANYRSKIGFAAVVSNLRCYVSANTYSGNCTVKVKKNGTSVITLTISAGATGWQENSSDTNTITDTDELSFEYDEGTSGSITIQSVGITFSAISTSNYVASERGTRGLHRGLAPTWR